MSAVRAYVSSESGTSGLGLAPEPRWKLLLQQVRATQIELSRSIPEQAASRRAGLAGNPGAVPSAVAVAQARLGQRLPPSYCQFLEFCDGWPRFFSGAHLLGSAEVGRPGCLQTNASPAQHAGSLSYLLPFGADDQGRTLFGFDTRVRVADGELPVIAWVGGLGVDCRCFTSFLATILQLCRAELAARLDPNDAAQPEAVLTQRKAWLKTA